MTGVAFVGINDDKSSRNGRLRKWLAETRSVYRPKNGDLLYTGCKAVIEFLPVLKKRFRKLASASWKTSR
jgi:hypothetical protein